MAAMWRYWESLVAAVAAPTHPSAAVRFMQHCLNR